MNVAWMDLWAAAMSRAAWQGGLALMVAWGACAAFRRTAPAVKCWLWRLGYLKFLVVLFLLFSISLPLLPATRGVAPGVPSNTMSPAATVLPFAAPAPAPSASAPPTVPALAVPAAPHAPPASHRPSLAAVLFALWLLGVCCAGLRVIHAWRHTRALRRAATGTTDPALHTLLYRLAAQLRLKNLPQLLAAPDATGPLLIGVLRPAILLPRSLLADPASEPLRLALTHELVHFRRRDILWNLLHAAVDALFFFHPLIYLARRQSRYWQELACDHLTLATAQATPAAYGRALLDILAQQRTPAPLLAGVGVADSANTLSKRLLALASFRPASSRRAVVAAILISLAAVTGVLPWRLVAQTAPPATSTAPATHAGRLDFRIAVLSTEIGADRPAAVDSLTKNGPATPAKVSGIAARWFEVHPSGTDNFSRGNFVTSTQAGKTYLLCYDDHDHTLTHADPARKPWSISAGTPYTDRTNVGICLPFKLDAVGATYMEKLTGANKGQPLTMLLDNRAISAPTIQSSISDAGVITFGSPTAAHPAADIQKEAEQIKDAINGTPGPARSTTPATGSGTSPETPPRAQDADATNLKGQWKIRSIAGNGDFRWRRTDAGDIVDIEKVSRQFPDIGGSSGSHLTYYVVSPDKTPKEIDVTFWVVNIFVTQRGIYQLDRDTLTLCMAPYNQTERPRNFTGEPGKSTLLVLDRVPADKAPAATTPATQSAQDTRPGSAH